MTFLSAYSYSSTMLYYFHNWKQTQRKQAVGDWHIGDASPRTLRTTPEEEGAPDWGFCTFPWQIRFTTDCAKSSKKDSAHPSYWCSLALSASPGTAPLHFRYELSDVCSPSFLPSPLMSNDMISIKFLRNKPKLMSFDERGKITTS